MPRAVVLLDALSVILAPPIQMLGGFFSALYSLGLQLGFVIYFLKVTLVCFCSTAAAVQHNGLAWGTLKKRVTKPSEQVAAPDCITHSMFYKRQPIRDRF